MLTPLVLTLPVITLLGLVILDFSNHDIPLISVCKLLISADTLDFFTMALVPNLGKATFCFVGIFWISRFIAPDLLLVKDLNS